MQIIERTYRGHPVTGQVVIKSNSLSPSKFLGAQTSLFSTFIKFGQNSLQAVSDEYT